MRHTAILLLFFILLCNTELRAQSPSVKGKVLDSITNAPITSGRVIISNVTGFSATFMLSEDGEFNIPKDVYVKATLLQVIADGYKNFSIKELPIFSNSDKTNNIGTFILKPMIINLKEVVIKKKRKYRDTLNIDLSEEHYERSFMIEDLLSGEKGFSRNADGKLFFKGKEVADIVLNDENFFGRNNLSIYKYLPSLTLNNIEITETDIDSITNTVMLRPRIKVNLKLKEKYNKGKFGSIYLGYGSAERYLAATDLYRYKKKEQVSLVVNTNNINTGDNPYTEPNVSFAANGNNTLSNSAKLTYRNLLFKDKVEIEGSVKGKTETRKFDSEMLRKDEIISQFAKTNNSSSSKNYEIESTSLNINYKINRLSSLRATVDLNYHRTEQQDSLAYEITSNDQYTASNVTKNRETSLFRLSNGIQYQKAFESKQGRSINFNLNNEINTYNISELNNVLSTNQQAIDRYFINGRRTADRKTLALEANYIEPIDDSAYLDFILNYKAESIKYASNGLSDTIPRFASEENLLNNNYLLQGFKLTKTFKKLSLNLDLINNINFRKINDEGKKETQVLYNLMTNAFVDYRINNKHNLSARYSNRINYPTVSQLTAINNSFDLVSQLRGNIYLKPEIGKKVEMIYNFRKTDSLTFSIMASAEFYKLRFGYNINNEPGSFQTNFIDNIGSSKTYDFVFSTVKTFKGGNNINYRLGLNYTETPIKTNQENILNSGITANQSVSSAFSIFKYLNILPTLSAYFSAYQYGSNQSKMYNLTYTDKISLNIPQICTLNLYPIVNYTYNINSNFSWAINGEIKRNFLKNYCSAWIKAYDIFNSFQYTNNYLGASYSQSLKYSNINSYLLIGVSIKFNNMR